MTLEEVMKRVKDQKYVGKVMGMEADLNDEINSELKYLKELQSLREDFKVFKRALELACKQITDFTGSCPFDKEDYEFEWCKGCRDSYLKCWKEYFLKKAGEEIEEE